MRHTIFSFFILLVGFLAGCSVQMADSAITPENVSISPDPEIAAAMHLIEKSPDLATGYNQLTVLYIKRARQTGDFQLNVKAEAANRKALELDPTNESARKLEASLNLTFHRFQDAFRLGTMLAKDFPEDAFVYGILTDSNAELGNYSDAVAAAQRMVDLRPNSNSYARVAHLRSLHGDHPGAVEMYTLAARTADPQDREAQSWCLVQLGDEFWKKGKFAESERVYDEALKQLPNYHLALEGKGRARAAQNDLAGAEKLFSEVQDRFPSTRVIVELAKIYELTGNTEKAASQYELLEKIVRRLGASGDQKDLALSWADRNMNLEEALQIAAREYELRKDIFTADLLAWCLFKKGRLAEARTAITFAMRLNTGDARMSFHAAEIEKGLGNTKNSKALCRQSHEAKPGF